MFEPLKDMAVFRRFEVSEVLHTLKWENDADLAPEFLYQRMVEQSRAPEPATTPLPMKSHHRRPGDACRSWR